MEKPPEDREFPQAIMHMDGDAFFVACEVAIRPELRGKPVVSGGERGIATAVSYEAKALGVPRGIPIFQLRKLFPQVIIMPGNYELYADYSKKMFGIVRRYVDDVEEYSIDECFADLTHMGAMNKKSFEGIARAIKDDIAKELGITVSLGVAPTKVLAKVASKWCKPNGLTMLPSSKLEDFLNQVPIGKVWGVGPSSAKYLRSFGVETAEDFTKKNEDWVKNDLAKPFYRLWQELRGKSVSHVDPGNKDSYATISRTRTFHPSTSDETFLLSQISKHLEDACTKARRHHLVARSVGVMLKTAQFRYHHIDIPLEIPTHAPEIIMSALCKKFSELYRKRVLYRASGVHLRGLISATLSQGDLFGVRDRIDKFETIHHTVDKLAERFGKNVVYLASTDQALKRDVERGSKDFNDPSRGLLFL